LLCLPQANTPTLIRRPPKEIFLFVDAYLLLNHARVWKSGASSLIVWYPERVIGRLIVWFEPAVKTSKRHRPSIGRSTPKAGSWRESRARQVHPLLDDVIPTCPFFSPSPATSAGRCAPSPALAGEHDDDAGGEGHSDDDFSAEGGDGGASRASVGAPATALPPASEPSFRVASEPQPPPSPGAPLQVASVAPSPAANRAAASATLDALALVEEGLLSRSVGVVALGPGIGRYDDADSCFDHGWAVTLTTAYQPLSGQRRLLCRRVIAVGLGIR